MGRCLEPSCALGRWLASLWYLREDPGLRVLRANLLDLLDTVAQIFTKPLEGAEGTIKGLEGAIEGAEGLYKGRRGP